LEITLRKTNSRRSKDILVLDALAAADEHLDGAGARWPAISGAFDSDELSTGTSRKPISTWPSAATTSAMIFLSARAAPRPAA
jgi:hypothetical protein